MESKDDCRTNNWDDCFDIVKSKKTFTVPCTRNVCESYTVNVPKTKAVNVTKQVPYMDYEQRIKQVPYQYFERQSVTRNVPTCRAIPRIQSVCTTVPVKRRSLTGIFNGNQSCIMKKCPRIVYVTKMCCEPRQFCQSIPRTGWKTVQEHVPVQKFRTETEVKYKTEHVPEVRYRTRPVTRIVKKTLPVYNIVPKPTPAPEEERVLRTILAPEEKSIVEATTVAQGNAIQTRAIPFSATENDQVTRISKNGNHMTGQESAYLTREQGARIGSGFPTQYGYRYNDYCQQMPMPAPMRGDVIPKNEDWKKRGIQFNDTDYQGKPKVVTSHRTRGSHGVISDYTGTRRGVNLGQRRL